MNTQISIESWIRQRHSTFVIGLAKDSKIEDKCIGLFTLGIADENAVHPLRKRIPAKEKSEWIRNSWFIGKMRRCGFDIV